MASILALYSRDSASRRACSSRLGSRGLPRRSFHHVRKAWPNTRCPCPFLRNSMELTDQGVRGRRAGRALKRLAPARLSLPLDAPPHASYREGIPHRGGADGTPHCYAPAATYGVVWKMGHRDSHRRRSVRHHDRRNPRVRWGSPTVVGAGRCSRVYLAVPRYRGDATWLSASPRNCRRPRAELRDGARHCARRAGRADRARHRSRSSGRRSGRPDHRPAATPSSPLHLSPCSRWQRPCLSRRSSCSCFPSTPPACRARDRAARPRPEPVARIAVISADAGRSKHGWCHLPPVAPMTKPCGVSTRSADRAPRASACDLRDHDGECDPSTSEIRHHDFRLAIAPPSGPYAPVPSE